MARSRTLSQLREDVLQLCEMSPGDFTSTDVVDRRINESCALIHGRLALGLGREYLYEETEEVVPPNSSVAIMSVDMAHITGVYYQVGSKWCPAFRMSSRGQYADAKIWQEKAVGYKPENFSGAQQKIRFSPPSPVAQSIRVGYIPAWTDLVESAGDGGPVDTDVLYLPDDFHIWVVYDAAIKMKVKEDTGVNDLLIVQAKLEKEIEAYIAAVDYQETDSMDNTDNIWGSWEGMY